MAKKQSDGEAAEAAGKRRPQKKMAAPRPGARSRPAKGGKPSKPTKPSKPSRSAKTARLPQPSRPPPAPAQAELPIGDADLIQDADIVSETLVDAAAGVYRYDQLRVLRETKVPAVLLEAGSIINRNEELQLDDSEHRALISAAVTDAMDGYCATLPRTRPVPVQAKR